MKKLALVFSAATAVVSLAECTNLSSEPENQQAYNACVDSYNNKFRFASMQGEKAMVAGVGAGTKCFWHWGEPDVNISINAAMQICRAEYSRCFLFATTGELTDWAEAINQAGGITAETIAARRQQQEDNETATALVGAFLQGLSSGAGSAHYPTMTYTPRSPAYTPNISTYTPTNITPPSIPNYPSFNYSTPTITPNIYNSPSSGGGTGVCGPWISGVSETCQ
jgi:hypothetical protein